MTAVQDGSDAAADPHVWLRMDVAWHVLHALAVGLAVVLVLTGDAPPAVRVPAVAVLAAIALGYLFLGRRALAGEEYSRGGAVHVALACPLVLGLFALDAGAGGVLLFTLYPHIWRMLPVRAAAVATVLVSGGVAGVQIVGGDTDPAAVPALLGWAAGTLALALALGLWITRVTTQSVRRAELLAQLEATRAELAEVSREAGAMAERERLSREIHDTLAQGFTSILLLARSAEGSPDPAVALRRIEETAQENLAESRALVAASAPAAFSSAGLPAALRRLTDRVGDELGLATAMLVEGPERTLPAAHEVVLLRAAQESFANVRKHAGARSAELTLTYGAGDVGLRVRDDGCGFDPAEPAAGSGFGLPGMRERVRSVGGTLLVRSAAGTGTVVEVALPSPVDVPDGRP